MAKCVSVPSRISLYMREDRVKEQCVGPKYSHSHIQRKHSGSCKTTLLSWKVHKLSASHVANLKVKFCLKETSVKCYCFGTVVNSDAATISDWVPVVDQVLLMASVFLTYMAGVIPAEKSLLDSRKNILNNNAVPEGSTFSGSAMKNDEEFDLKFPWDIVKEKLMDSLNAIEHVVNLENRILEFESDRVKRPLSLYALAEGPMLRLLLASFMQLRKEVDNISERPANVRMDEWLTVSSEIIQMSCQPVCMAWLEKEICLKNSKSDKAFISIMVEKLDGDDIIFQNIRKSGKEDLYAELLYFLRFGSPREGCWYDYSLFTLHGVAILEDLVITVADGIASMYLELISVDGNMSNEIISLGSFLCTLSTRALQRLRNEVALNQWLHQNMEAVVSMYEDRFDLCILQSQLIEEPSKSQTEKISWWKKLTRSNSKSTLLPLCYASINYVSIPVKRTRELRALTGWRYYFSLIIELADITMPLIRTVIAKVRDAISFFLVCLIGRSLGLIYTGIRQSLRWK
ncbi:uncharacterized protein LOC132269123 isoform X2 [Cornus florida]|uniref:uncharacterized protein LOC132269123 isoform X2 n=1 Tax=Cornus florida TaxID=4283 RepID=UPI0028A1DA47|nr:uncharacterized protein LOC132269123 isoform X2 [Cornus florida]